MAWVPLMLLLAKCLSPPSPSSHHLVPLHISSLVVVSWCVLCRGTGQAGIVATVGDKLNSLLSCFSLIGSQPVVGISHYQLYTNGKEFFFN